MRKPAFCISENKDADQLCGNHEADQRLCFRYIDSTIPLLPKHGGMTRSYEECNHGYVYYIIYTTPMSSFFV